MSIHQPRYSIYKCFDNLTLLSKGHLVYHGQSSKSLGYFNSLGTEINSLQSCFVQLTLNFAGFNCEEHDNPADFLLDVVNWCEKDRTLAITSGICEIKRTRLN